MRHAPPELWKRVGRQLPWLPGGVLMVEASKQVYAPTRGGLPERAKKPVRIWEGAAHPVGSPKQG